MDSGSKSPGSLLRRGLAIIGGATAIGAGSRAVRDVGAAPVRGRSLTVYGRKRPVAGTGTEQVLTYGELIDAPDGRAIGEFRTNCFCLPNLDFHVLQFKDGTLFGLRGGYVREEPAAGAIVGGTGRYAGASGTLVERPVEGGTRGHDLVEFIVTLAS